MPWLLLSLAAAVATATGPSAPPWGRRAAAQLAAQLATAWTNSDAAKAADIEEVLAAGGNADSPWNKPRRPRAGDLLLAEFWLEEVHPSCPSFP